MIRHSLPDSERSEPGPACAVSSGSPFLPLSPVCCPASSTAACPHLFSCFLFLSHLIASSLCSSGFAFWILLLSSRATVSVSLPRSLLYSCPLSPCPANSRALIRVLVLPIACVVHVLPTPPISPVQSSAMGALPSMGARSLWILSAISTHCLCLSPPSLCMGFCSMGCKPQFLFDLISPALGVRLSSAL